MRGKDRWRASLSYQGKVIALGHFLTKEEAAVAYDNKIKQLYGKFSKVNFA